MNCQKCQRIIHENMKFCPYCGEKARKDVRNKNYDKEDILIRSYAKQKQYSKILDLALQGNAYAEYAYITKTIGKENWHMGNEDYKTLNNLCPNPVAMAIIGIVGIFTVLEKRTTISKELLDKYINMIEQSSEKEDPAALWAMGRFYLGTITAKYKRNEMKVYRYMTLAADKKYPQAMLDLGIWHCTGENGMDKDEDKGLPSLYKGLYYAEAIAFDKTPEDAKGIAQLDLNAYSKEVIQNSTKYYTNNAAAKKHVVENVLDFNNKSEIELWKKIQKYTDVDELEKIGKEIEEIDYPGADKEFALHWLQKSVSDINKFKKQVKEREKKRRELEQAKERQRLEEERQRLEKERQQKELIKQQQIIADQNKDKMNTALAIINGCESTEDYLCALEKIKSLNMPESLFQTYRGLLTKLIQKKYSNEIEITKNPKFDGFDAKMFLITYTVLGIIGFLLIKFLLWLKMYIGFLSTAGIVFIIGFYLIFVLATFTDFKTSAVAYLTGRKSNKLIERFIEKGYDIYDDSLQ